MGTNSESITIDGPRAPLPARRVIAAVVLAIVFGTGMFVGRVGAPTDRGTSAQSVDTKFPTPREMRDPAVALHRRIYAHFPNPVGSISLDREDLSDPFADLHRRIYAHFPEI